MDRPRCPTCGCLRPGQPKGEAHHAARMTEAKVKEMRGKYERGEGTYLSLSIEYDLAYSTVGNIIRRRTWRHV